MEKGRALLAQNASVLLYERQAPTILAYFYRQTASWDDAEDLLVEVFLAALEEQRFSKISENEQQRWLWKVARNKVADHFRRFKRQPSLTLDLEVMEAIIEDTALTPEKSLLRQEEYQDLYAALRTLPQAQRDVLELRFGHELSCGEIATVLAKTEGAVRMLLSRTLKHLRGLYKKSWR